MERNSAIPPVIPIAALEAIPLADRPREKLSSRGEACCRDDELLAVLLRVGNRREPVLDFARRILFEVGGIAKLEQAQVGELRKIRGVGLCRAATLVAAFALARRAAKSWQPGETFSDSRQIFQHYQPRFQVLRKERFYALLLDSKNRLIREELVSEGTLTASLVHPREVFGPAIREAAAAIIVLHNHPSGDPQPSPEDHEVTRRLKDNGKMLGIPLLDHLILGKEGYFSFFEKGQI